MNDKYTGNDEVHQEIDPLAELARIVAGEGEPHSEEPQDEVSSQQEYTEDTQELESMLAAGHNSEMSIDQLQSDEDFENELAASLLHEFEDESESADEIPSTEELSIDDLEAVIDEASAEIEKENLEAIASSNVSTAEADFVHNLAAEEVTSVKDDNPPADANLSFEDELLSTLEAELSPQEQVAGSSPSEVESESDKIVVDQDNQNFFAARISSIDEIDQAFIEDSAAEVSAESDVVVDANPAPTASHTDDLGDVFANEFAQMMETNSASSKVPDSHIPTEFQQVDEIEASAVSTSDQASSEMELDFETAFAEELNSQQLADTQEWAETSEFDEDRPVGFADNAIEDPGHSGMISETEYASHNSPSQQVENEPSSKKHAVAALVIALFAGVIAAGYGLLGGDGASNVSSDVPIIEASSEPVKVKPEDPGGRIVANQDNASYEKVEGNDTTALTQESLISKTEEPADIEMPENASTKNDDRLASSDTSESDDSLNSSVKPRVVQVVTVKPDGTIVTTPAQKPPSTSTETTQVASLSLPQEVAEPKPVETQTIKPLEPIDGAKTTNEPSIPTARPLEKPAPKPVASTPPASAPVPLPKPVAVTPAPVTAAPAAPAVTTAPASEWSVQVSSQRSEQAAQQSYANMQNRYAALQGRTMRIQSANVNGATYYRVRVQASSKSDATQLCSQISSSGGSCFVTR